MIAFVRSVIFWATEAGSRFRVRGLTSANTTRAPFAAAALAVEIQLIGVVITSSPGSIPAAITANSRPAVPEVTASPYLAPQYAAKLSSNFLTFGPHEGAPARNTSTSAASSSGPYAEPWPYSSSWIAFGSSIGGSFYYFVATRHTQPANRRDSLR